MVYVSRNADLRVCSDDFADLAFRFSHILLPAEATVYGNFDFMRTCNNFGGCLCAQMGLASTGCLDDVNLLCL